MNVLDERQVLDREFTQHGSVVSRQLSVASEASASGTVDWQTVLFEQF